MKIPIYNHNDKFRDYQINFVGLKLGNHNFQYQLTETFFELLDYATLQKGKVAASLELTKGINILTLNFQFDGFVEVECDRCLGLSPFPIETKHGIFVKFSEMAESLKNNTDEDIMYLLPETNHLNIAHIMYELISLSLPMQKVPCEYDEEIQCDENILQILDANNNMEAKTTTESNDIDPRWAALKNLKNKK
ncbi:MAG: YceD family protein [Chitinophagales bacterium]